VTLLRSTAVIRWLLVFAALVDEPSARASTPITWEAPRGCPDGAAVLAKVERLLQRPVEPGELELVGRVRWQGETWHLDVRVVAGGVPDDRVLVADECAVLGDAAALVAAVLLDPVVAAQSVDVAPTSIPPPGSGVAPPPDIAPRASTNRGRSSYRLGSRGVRRRDVGVWLRASAGGEYGALPGTGAVSMAIAVGTSVVRGEIAGSWLIPRRVGSPDRVRVQLGTVMPRVCGMWPKDRLALVGCGGVELGVMRADFANRGVAQPLWVALAGEIGMRWVAAPRVSLWVSGLAVVPVVYPDLRRVDRVDADRHERVYQPAPVGVRGLAGVEIRLRGRDGARKR
jgi:hypothetical protein